MLRESTTMTVSAKTLAQLPGLSAAGLMLAAGHRRSHITSSVAAPLENIRRRDAATRSVWCPEF
jgi:hypothetical protein